MMLGIRADLFARKIKEYNINNEMGPQGYNKNRERVGG